MDKRVRRGTLFGSVLLVVVALLVSMLAGSGSALGASADSAASTASRVWSFGVMADTQWTTTDPANQNPDGVAVSIANQLNKQFINKGVKFVIQVGDLTEDGNDAAIAVRANAAQALYARGIGFFPMRGNHETYTGSTNNYGITAFLSNFPQTQGISHTFGATNFSSPVLAGSYPNDLKGMSYSFDFGAPGSKARFLIIDDWVTPNKLVNAAGYPYGYSVGDQQSWISAQLDEATRGTEHAFVFSHQNLIGENHQDSVFSGYTNANLAMQNAFFASLDSNDVGYYICGHDHVHQRSIIASPDGLSSVEELICASNSSKFYTPKAVTDSKWYGQKTRETSVQQELNTIGYYIFTIDGPRVTVDYYADDRGNWLSDASYPEGPTGSGSHVTPILHFVKKATWGYSTNGQEFLVGGSGGTSYTSVQDTFQNGSAKILSGAYANTLADYNGRVLTQTVNTGWSPVGASNVVLRSRVFSGNVLTLWGMAPLGAGRNSVGAAQTATYTLSLSCNLRSIQFAAGNLIVSARDSKGTWVNAVNLNLGGTKSFVKGPWNSSYGLGTYGFDPGTKTAWAVLNYNADFVVANNLEPVLGRR